MPDVGLVGANGPFVTVLVSNEFPFNGGPYPGTVNFLFVHTFTGFAYSAPPNAFGGTSSPHWTAHPIWTSANGAGYVVHRKTEAYANTQFKAYAMAMGYASAKDISGDAMVGGEIKIVTEEEFERMSGGQYKKGSLQGK